MKKRTYRINLTIDPEMWCALEILRVKSGLALATEATYRLRTALYQTIQSEACQLRVRQDAAFATRDQWIEDTVASTYVSNAVRAAEGIATDAPPA